MKRLVVGALLLGAVVLVGCAPKPDVEVPVKKEAGYEIDAYDLSTFEATLPSGKKIECVALTIRGSALQCWPVIE